MNRRDLFKWGLGAAAAAVGVGAGVSSAAVDDDLPTIVGFGDGAGSSYSDHLFDTDTFIARYTHRTYALGYMISDELEAEAEYQDDLPFFNEDDSELE